METFLPLLLIPFVVTLFFTAIDLFCRHSGSLNRTVIFKTGPSSMSVQKRCLILFGAALGQLSFFFASSGLLRRYFADAEGSLPPAVLVTICLCSSGCLWSLLVWGKKRLYRFLRGCTLLALTLFVLELLIFNGKSLTKDFCAYTLTQDSIQIETAENAHWNSQGALVLTGDATLILTELPDFTRVISIEAVQEKDDPAFRIQLKLRDDNFAGFYQTVSDKLAGGHGYPCELSLAPYGQIRSLQLVISDIQDAVTLQAIHAASSVPFRFSTLRYMALFLVFFIILAIKATNFSKVSYHRQNPKHMLAVYIMVLLCTASPVLFGMPSLTLMDYPEGNEISSSDPYTQTLDAFLNGRVWIDIPVDEKLEELENVYDADERRKAGVAFAWDRAYYEGKYYSYFGVTPVLLFYLPVYLLTGALPTLALACGFFGMLSILFICLAILAAVRLFVPRANLLLLLLLLPAAACIGGAYYCFQYPNIYDVAVASGQCLLFLSIWAGLRVSFTGSRGLKLFMLVLCGLSLGLCAGCRPSMAICGLLLLPLFLYILFDKKEAFRFRLTQAAAFLLPVLLSAAGLMYYNHLRFGSPLDFGAGYQLTVSDIQANHLRLSALFPAIYHYFLQPLGTSSVFPFFEIQSFSMGNYGMYAYTAIMFGACCLPIILLGLLLTPSALNDRRLTSRPSSLRRKGFIITCFLLSLLIAWADFCLAGVNIRYLLDFMPLLILGSACTIMISVDRAQSNRYFIAIGALILTVLILFLILLTDTSLTLTTVHPNLYDLIEDLLIFWQ